MSTFVVPISSPTSRLTIDYDVRGTLFQFLFYFNSRDSRWYMDILDANTLAQIRTGIKLVADYPLLNNFLGESRPNGEVTALDTSGQGDDPQEISELGARIQVLIREFVQDFP